MMEQSTSHMKTARQGCLKDGDTSVVTHRHSLGVGIGAVVAASTAGATGGVLVGPIGAIVGAVVGAVAGGLGGQAIAELVDPAIVEDHLDSYTHRTHRASETNADEERSDSSSGLETKPAPREMWHHLDQSSKDLLSDTLSDEP